MFIISSSPFGYPPLNLRGGTEGGDKKQKGPVILDPMCHPKFRILITAITGLPEQARRLSVHLLTLWGYYASL